ncbi:MAG: response regulator transcription factor [Acidobacteria bacterium]|jgi:DNA-binding NarL/FixJ family response regulator|nr:response regulator transcription factor [Acidobacteriota bacterium]
MKKKKAVFIVDDHPIMRDGISQLIDQQPDLEVCGSASSAPEALNALNGLAPDLLLVDISLSGMNGIDLIKIVKKRSPRLPALILSMHSEDLYAERAIRAGAKGYVMKHASSDTLLAAIRRVVEGRMYLSPEMTEKLLEKAAGGNLPGNESPVDRLSDRELEIFKLIGQGLRPQRIAEELLLSIKTVETYYSRIKQKLNIKDADELLRMAIAWHPDLEETKGRS